MVNKPKSYVLDKAAYISKVYADNPVYNFVVVYG